jgi:hypothetical protein
MSAVQRTYPRRRIVTLIPWVVAYPTFPLLYATGSYTTPMEGNAEDVTV